MVRLACIDLGSSVISVIIAALSNDLRPTVLGRGWAPSAGIAGGEVLDLEAAGRALAAALEAAERAASCHVGKAILALNNKNLQVTERWGRLTVAREPTRINRRHAVRAINSVILAGAEAGEEFLHVIPRRFWLDGRHMARNPLGMPAAKLDVETLAIAGQSVMIRNAVRSVQDQGLEVRELVVSPLAAGEALLSGRDREAGVVLLDLGADSTSAVVYSQGSPAAMVGVPLGGRTITADIAMVLRISLRQAERLKHGFGRADASTVDDTLLEVPDDEEIGVEPVSHRLLCEVIQARLEEIFEQIMAAIADTGFSEPLPAGVVLTGGGAALPDGDAAARRLFALPARVGMATLPGAHSTALAPSWSAAAGLLRWAQRGQPDLLPDGSATTRVGSQMGRFVRQLLPLGGE